MIQKKPLIGVGVLILKGDLILMSKRQTSHGTGFWAFPGGHLEFNETVEECVKRELFEETGLVAKTIIKGPWKEAFFESDSKHYINLFGIVREFSGSLENKEPQKSSEWKWFPIDQLPSPLFHPIESIAKDGSLVDFLAPYRKPKLSYLSAPFSHPDPTIQQARYEEITAAAGHLIKAGTYVYSPLTHNIPIKNLGIITTWEEWKPLDFAMIDQCDQLIIYQMEGWETSRGVQEEVAYAKEKNIPIIEMKPLAFV